MGKKKRWSRQRLISGVALCAFLLAGCNQPTITSSASQNTNASSTVSTSASAPSTSASSPATSNSNPKKVDLVSDPTFKSGFYLKSPDTSAVSIERHFDYQGTASSAKRTWDMAQWWTPFDFKDASEVLAKTNTYRYENQSRFFEVNPTNGALSFGLNSWKEYQEKFGGSRSATSQNWSHFLLEQSFETSVALNTLASLNVRLDFAINSVEQFDLEHYNSNLHAAQFLWYFVVRNVVPEDSDPNLVGQNGDFLWFGVPLYDNRNDYLPVYHNYDGGFAGATNKLIYSMDNREYLPVSAGHPLEFQKTYAIDYDILPAIKDAFVNGKQAGALPNCQFQNMRVDYMNFGWELPGSFAVDCSIANWGVNAIYA